MPRFIMLVAIAVVAWLIYKLYYQKLRQQGKPGMIKLGLIALGLIFMALAITGRAHILFAVIGAALTQIMRLMPLLIRFFPAIQQILNSNRTFGGSSPQNSSIRTRLLSINLDHASGNIDGEVTAGKFSGRVLSTLSREELSELYEICRVDDPEGMRLLDAYLSRLYGEQAGNGNTDSIHEPSARPAVGEAREILGVDEKANKSEIVAAHRRLMGKLHPDKGGSTYLAAKINAAKEVLLDNLKQHEA